LSLNPITVEQGLEIAKLLSGDLLFDATRSIPYGFGAARGNEGEMGDAHVGLQARQMSQLAKNWRVKQ
jgi:RecA/RadA recombinase